MLLSCMHSLVHVSQTLLKCEVCGHGLNLIDFNLVFINRHVASGGAGGAAAPPDFGRSEGAAGQRRRAALLPAPLDF